MSTKEVLAKFYSEMLKVLPMGNPAFLAILEGCKLLPGDTRDRIQAERTKAEKATCLIENVIKTSPNLYLPKLLQAMEKYHKENNDIALNDLADDLQAELNEKATGQTEIPGNVGSEDEVSEYKVDHLWSEDDLHDMGYGSKTISTLPVEDPPLLDQVILLLLTVNKNEDNAAFCYLEPLPGHTNIYKHMDYIKDGIQTQHAIYFIGKYGACPAALTQIKPGAEYGGAITAPNLAFRCFKNLKAIIGVGVACGVEKRVKICDVLVADKVNTYDQARLQEGGTLNRGYAVPTSELLSKLFRQRDIKWPDDDVKNRVDKGGVPKPKIKQGVILSGPYLIDNKNIKKDLIQNFAAEAIGIEMEAAYLIKAVQGVSVHITIVKAVCDFGDGKKSKHFQPTAALLAANCVKKYFDDPEVVKMLLGTPDDASIALKMQNLTTTNQGGTFDCVDAAKTLRTKNTELINLPYRSMRGSLYGKGVITRNEKEKLDKMTNSEQMSELIDILISSLELKSTKKYKRFLQSLEESDDVLLSDVAEKLGGSKRVPE